MGFLDQVIGGIDKGVSTTKEKTKLLVEKSRVQTQMTDAAKEKDRLLLNLGNLVYNLYVSDTVRIEQCAGLYGEVDKLTQRIQQLQNEYETLENTKVEYNPGYGVQSNAGYGAQPGAAAGVQCSCGFVNKEGAKFCAKCGNSLTG